MKNWKTLLSAYDHGRCSLSSTTFTVAKLNRVSAIVNNGVVLESDVNECYRRSKNERESAGRNA